jgi:dihydroflavonol-4-reductase
LVRDWRLLSLVAVANENEPAIAEDLGMRIFVTGATGFIGAHFVERALAAGHGVVGMYRSNGPRHRQLIAYLTDHGAELCRGDILEPETFADTMRAVDCVCHFAAAFREPGADQAFFNRINVEGTANVARHAARHGVRRFVHCSTAGVYGHRVNGVIDESAPLRPWNSYERSKIAAEEEVRKIAEGHGMEYVILRPTAVYGPRDERLLKLFRSVAKGRFPLFGEGAGRRHMIYVTDLADAFLRACASPAATNQELIVAGPRAVPLRDLLDTLAQAANRRDFGPRLPLRPMLALAGLIEDLCTKFKVNPPLYRRRMDFYLNDTAFDSQRAQDMLEWQPKVDLPEGLAATLESSRRGNHSGALAGASLAMYLLGLVSPDL